MNRRALGVGRLERRKQGKQAVWLGDWKDADGNRHRQVLSSDRRVAERILADLIRQRDLVAAGLAVEEGFDRSLDALIEDFMAELRAGRSKRYADRAEAILRRIAGSTGARTIRELLPQQFLLYRRMRLAEGVANRTANMELTVLRTMLNWAVRIGCIAHNPLQEIQSLPAGKGYERKPRRAMTEDEIERFLAASAAIDRQSTDYALATKSIAGHGAKYAAVKRKPVVPQTPMWLALLETGARLGELTQATWGDLSEQRATLTLRASTTKSRKERTIPIRQQLLETLISLRFTHHVVRGRIPTAGDHIFLSPRSAPWIDRRRQALTRFEAILERAGIPKTDERGQKLDIHSLRHTFASRLARNGVGLAQAQRLLGHSDPKLTMVVYTHLEVDDLRAAVEGIPICAPVHRPPGGKGRVADVVEA